MPDNYVSSELRRLVTARAQGCCEYCRTQTLFTGDPFALDHIYPTSLGGLTVAGNLVFSCTGCNQCKGARIAAIDPVTELLVPLFHPRLQNWDDNFEWSEDYTTLSGRTATGNATIVALQLNRVGLVNLRRVLFEAGLHPPNLAPVE